MIRSFLDLGAWIYTIGPYIHFRVFLGVREFMLNFILRLSPTDRARPVVGLQPENSAPTACAFSSPPAAACADCAWLRVAEERCRRMSAPACRSSSLQRLRRRALGSRCADVESALCASVARVVLLSGDRVCRSPTAPLPQSSRRYRFRCPPPPVRQHTRPPRLGRLRAATPAPATAPTCCDA